MEIVAKSTELSPKSYPDVLETIAQTERLEVIVRWSVIALLVGLPVVTAVARLRLGAAIFDGVIMFVIALLVVRTIRRFVLRPMRAVRYKGCAKRLAAAVQGLPVPVSQWLSWWQPVPGALAVTENGQLVIVDRSTEYEELWLHPTQIASATVEREATMITSTRHSGRFSLGGASGGLFGGYTFGGRSSSVTRSEETAFLEIRYQLTRNGMTYTTVIPFGADRRGADALCATIVRLDHQPAG